MSRPEDEKRLRHMLDSAREVQAMVQGLTQEMLEENRTLHLAVVRLLEIVGEASTHVSADQQNNNPEIPWEHLRGFRNRIVHGYDVIDFDVVWKIIQNDLPPLIEEIERILDPE